MSAVRLPLYSRLAVAAALLFGGAVPAGAAPLGDGSRLVVIGGSLTEIVYALGEEARLVARDSTAMYPQAALALPDVGYMRQLSPEGVLSVNPTALLVLDGAGPPDALQVLEASGVEYRAVAEGYTEEGIVGKVRAVGDALRVPDKAEKLAGELQAALDAVEAKVAKQPERQRILFVLTAQDGKLMVSGSGTAANAVIGLAGAENAISGFEGYRPLADEAIVAAAPDAVLMMDNAGNHQLTPEALFAHPGLALTPAGEAKRLIHMDAAYLLGFGPRTPEAIGALADAIYGGAQ